MNVVIRVDASTLIGTGHVMRCITLADILNESGYTVYFVCRDHEGHMAHHIHYKGYYVYMLAREAMTTAPDIDEPLAHAHWLGCTQSEDADLCVPIVESLKPTWIIVDHYALDYRWQEALQKYSKMIMVIDDLADRKHRCHLLLDQTFNRNQSDYKDLVPSECKLLVGSQYALLRPEFGYWRDFSLKRRHRTELKRLMIFMGGTDFNNITGRVLEMLKNYQPIMDVKVTVVMNNFSPNLESVQTLAGKLPFRTEVVVNISNMAELMAKSDLAIGAAGATTWERCCLGLPSILFILASNQTTVAEKLSENNILEVLSIERLSELCSFVDRVSAELPGYSNKMKSVTDGNGCVKVLESMNSFL